MIPIDLLKLLKAEGISVFLSLKVEADTEPSAETVELLKACRGDLLEHLVRQRAPQSLTLHGPISSNLLHWLTKYHELRVIHQNGLILNARAHHVIEVVQVYSWGVVCNSERYLLLSWGKVPTYELEGLRNLETGELLVAEAVAAWARPHLTSAVKG